MKKIKSIGIFFIIFFLILVSFFSIFLVTNTIYPGVTINGQSMVFKGEREARTEIQNRLDTVIENKITIITEKNKGSIYIKDVLEPVDIDSIVKEAMATGRTGSLVNRVQDVFTTMFHGKDLVCDISFNEEALKQKIEELSLGAVENSTPRNYVIKDGTLYIDGGGTGKVLDIDKIMDDIKQRILTNDLSNYSAPYKEIQSPPVDLDQVWNKVTTQAVDAYYDTNTRQIVEGQQGVSFDLEAAKKAIDINGTQVQTIPLVYTNPKVMAADLQDLLFQDTLGKMTTYYSSGTNRGHNIELISSVIDGTVLQPGEVFSFNGTTGNRTAEKGYKEAAIFLNGKVTNGMAGGICQVSTTLYDATLYADLEIVERTNHGLMVSYVKGGWDATVSYGSLDYKFKNNTDYPVRIDISAKNGVLTVELVGTKTSDKKVSLKSKYLKYENGYTYYELYKTVTENGKSVTIKENTSRYKT